MSRTQIVPGVTVSSPEGDPLLDPFKRTLLKSLLRFQVGQAIFCPGNACGGAVLDARRAVGLGTHTVCTTCWGSLSGADQQSIVAAAAKTKPAPTELLDGPALHGKTPVIPALAQEA